MVWVLSHAKTINALAAGLCMTKVRDDNVGLGLAPFQSVVDCWYASNAPATKISAIGVGRRDLMSLFISSIKNKLRHQIFVHALIFRLRGLTFSLWAGTPAVALSLYIGPVH